MPDETKDSQSPAPGQESPKAASGAGSSPAESTPAAPAAPVPAAPPVAAKPAPAPAAAPKPPARPAAPTPQPWECELTAQLKQTYGSGIREAVTYVGQPYLVVDKSIAHDILRFMRDDEKFDYLVDLTCVHYPAREEQFEIVWILYSFSQNIRVRVKTSIKDGEDVESVCSLWTTANWLEREAYDMFGVKFAGHPDLRRILLPEDWSGFPLRKDHGILQQDTEWVHKNLGIERAQ